MNNIFRKATIEDASGINGLIAQAQEYFKINQIDQWQNGYPNHTSTLEDIQAGACYVIEKDHVIIATAALYFRQEEEYSLIYKGNWHTSSPYAAIHRVAVHTNCKGTGTAADLYTQLEEVCRSQSVGNVRGDTHRDNIPMQKFMKKMGFSYSGIIYLKDGAERLAYDKIIV